MPGKNSVKIYIEGGYYHIYNRGVEKRLIFQDYQDYDVFLSYLKGYLSKKDENELRKQLQSTKGSDREREMIWRQIRLQNFWQDLDLIAYCLMPNHFHLVMKQKSLKAIEKFMASLGVRYTMYFNRKNERVGALFQGVFKAVLVNSDEQLAHLTRYVHKQALFMQGETLHERQPCSYLDYIGIKKTEWVHPEEVLAFFSKVNPSFSYEQFVQELVDQEIDDESSP